MKSIIYTLIKADYPEHDERFLYFLATCLHLDPDVNLEIALMFGPYGGSLEPITAHWMVICNQLKCFAYMQFFMMPLDLLQSIAINVQDALTFCLVQPKTLKWVT